MNILFITAGSGPDTTIGGSLLRTVEIAKRIKKRHHIFVLTTTGGKIAIRKSFSARQILEIKTPTSDFSSNKLFLFQLILSWFKIIFSSFHILRSLPGIELIYLDSDGIWDVFPAVLYKIRHPNVAIVSMNHHSVTLNKKTTISFFGSLLNIFLQRIGRYLIRKFSSAVFILDTHSGQLIAKEYKAKKYIGKIYFVKNGIDIKAVSKLKKTESTYYDACFFGYLRPSKGLYDIIPIWKKVASVIPAATLAIIGGMLPQYKNFLIEQIKLNNLQKNIIFIGYIEDKKKALETVKKSRIFLSPSHEEGWGIASMECLAVGLPGVVWDLKTYQSIIKTGVIRVPPYNLNLFAEKIIKLLKNNKLYINLKGPHSFLKQYAWDFVAKQDLKNFREILQI